MHKYYYTLYNIALRKYNASCCLHSFAWVETWRDRAPELNLLGSIISAYTRIIQFNFILCSSLIDYTIWFVFHSWIYGDEQFRIKRNLKEKENTRIKLKFRIMEGNYFWEFKIMLCLCEIKERKNSSWVWASSISSIKVMCCIMQFVKCTLKIDQQNSILFPSSLSFLF